MSEPYLGQIYLVPYNFAPKGFAFCAGQILPIAQNIALFSLLGITFGGNGQTTFALPDLRGRVPVGAGQGPGLANVNLGQVAGQENVTLLESQMPAHSHLAGTSQAGGTSTRPSGKVPASGPAIYADASDGSTFNPAFGHLAGGGEPFDVRNPYLGLNYVIALVGVYPSRND